MPASLVEGVLMDTEASVMATFDFIGGENVDDDEENLRYEKFDLDILSKQGLLNVHILT